MKAHQLKTLAAFTSLAVALFAVVQPVSALTVPEAITSIQSSNPTLPTGVANPKGNIGFLLANMFWNSSDVGYDSTKFGKIKPTYFDGAGATAWTYAGGDTYMTDMNGRVGVGTNDPQAYLHLKSNLADHSAALLVESPSAGSSSPRIALVDTSSGSVASQPAWLVDNAYDRFRIFRQPNITNPGSVHLAISWSGNTAVGDGLSDFIPSATFEARNTSSNSNYSAWIEGGNVANYGLGVNIANVTNAKSIANFKSNNVSRLFVRADGNVGMGTISPESVLDVAGDVSMGTRLRYTSINGDYFWLRSRLWSEPNALSVGIESDETTGTTKTIRMLTNGVGRFFIAQDGKVGIGTLSPSTTLDVNGQIRIAWGTPGVGKILTSDATGIATWTSPSAAYSEIDPKVATTSTGYLARWNGSQLINSNVYDNGTNVGIGTASPSSALTVNGDVSSRRLLISGWNGTDIVKIQPSDDANPTYNALAIGNAAWTNWPIQLRKNGDSYFAGNMGIGTTNPTTKLQVAGKASATGFWANQWVPDASDSSTNGYSFGTDGDTGMFSPVGVGGANNGIVAFYGNNVETMRILPTLSVGIGTTNPAASLEIKRSVADSNYAAWIEGTNSGNFGLGVNIANTTTTKAIADFRSANVSRLHVRADGNVGIGTTTPNATLNVVGWANFSRDNAAECCSSANATISLAENTNSTGKMSTIQFHNSGVAEGYLRLTGSGTRRFQMGDNQGVNMGLQMSGNLQVDGTGNSYVSGNVGIGTSSPGYKLDVAGTANVTGFRMPTGAGAGKVLTSDASGVATWATPATGGGITAVTTASCTYSETSGCTATCPATYYRTGCGSGGGTYAWSNPSWSNACVFTTSSMSWFGYAYCAK